MINQYFLNITFPLSFLHSQDSSKTLLHHIQKTPSLAPTPLPSMHKYTTGSHNCISFFYHYLVTVPRIIFGRHNANYNHHKHKLSTPPHYHSHFTSECYANSCLQYWSNILLTLNSGLISFLPKGSTKSRHQEHTFILEIYHLSLMTRPLLTCLSYTWKHLLPSPTHFLYLYLVERWAFHLFFFLFTLCSWTLPYQCASPTSLPGTEKSQHKN